MWIIIVKVLTKYGLNDVVFLSSLNAHIVHAQLPIFYFLFKCKQQLDLIVSTICGSKTCFHLTCYGCAPLTTNIESAKPHTHNYNIHAYLNLNPYVWKHVYKNTFEHMYTYGLAHIHILYKYVWMYNNLYFT